MLYLECNRLHDLPRELAACTRLKRLWVHRNPLTWLPPTLTLLKCLYSFTTSNTLLTDADFCQNYDELQATQALLQRVAQHFTYSGARAAAVTLLALHRRCLWHQRRHKPWFPLNVVEYVLAPMLYDTRADDEWRELDAEFNKNNSK